MGGFGSDFQVDGARHRLACMTEPREDAQGQGVGVSAKLQVARQVSRATGEERVLP